jgi:curved DNA-binding protein CbpA
LPDYYAILGVVRAAGPKEIHRAYRQLARLHHPDVSTVRGAAERFKEINEAHAVLSDPKKRADYDALLRQREVPSQTNLEDWTSLLRLVLEQNISLLKLMLEQYPAARSKRSQPRRQRRPRRRDKIV